MLNISSLESFQAVIDHRSMTAAAKELSLAVSTVSTHVKQVSDFVGEPLLERTETGYVPTPAGRRVYRSATNVLTELNRIHRPGRRTVAELARSPRLATMR